MTQQSSPVHIALCKALLEMLRSRNLTPEDAQWVEQFALRTIAEFNLLKSQSDKETPEKPIAV